MTPAICLRSLSRPAAAIPSAPRIIPILAAAPFSTTSTARAVVGTPAKTQAKPVQKFRVKITQAVKKNVVRARTKRPEQGARKAFRRRIVLSNNNAMPVHGLGELGARTMLEAQSTGTVVAVPGPLVDQLRAAEAFKPSQHWGLFRQPHMLIRKETVELVTKMKNAQDHKKVLRLVLSGDRISGKSTMLLQAMAHALMNQWVVINIPEAQELVNANVEYSPIPDTDPVQFTQPTYCQRLLQNIFRTNEEVLKVLRASKDYTHINPHIPEAATLADLAACSRDAEVAWPVLRALWDELTAVPGRPPVLLALDGLAHAMRPSAYRDPAFRPVHAHDLVLVRLFCDALSGAAQLPNGGAVLAATSRGNNPAVPSVELAVARGEARAAGAEPPAAEAYGRGYDARVDAVLRDVEVLRLAGTSREEARAVMEYWAKSGLLRARVTEVAVTEKWMISGNGNLGELERAALLNMRVV